MKQSGAQVRSRRASQRWRRAQEELVDRISGWAGDCEAALAWHRETPIPAFGGGTTKSLVEAGEADAVRDYMECINYGGFA